MLASSRTNIQKGDEKARENVHWNNDNYRPDKSTKLINELYQRLENKKSTQTRDKSFNSVTKRDRVAEVSGWGINASAKLAAEFSTEGTGSKENMQRLLDETKLRPRGMEWISFPNDLDLFSMNKGRFKDKFP